MLNPSCGRVLMPPLSSPRRRGSRTADVSGKGIGFPSPSVPAAVMDPGLRAHGVDHRSNVICTQVEADLPESADLSCMLHGAMMLFSGIFEKIDYSLLKSKVWLASAFRI